MIALLQLRQKEQKVQSDKIFTADIYVIKDMQKVTKQILLLSESKKYTRASKSSAVEMLSEKYARKAEIKEKELELRKMELEFEKQKYYDEAKLREARAELELEERRAFFSLLQNKQ